MFKGYEINTWNALMAPKGTPDAVVAVLNQAVARSLAVPALQTRFKGEGATPGASSPAELGQFVNAELARWAGVIKEVGIQIE